MLPSWCFLSNGSRSTSPAWGTTSTWPTTSSRPFSCSRYSPSLLVLLPLPPHCPLKLAGSASPEGALHQASPARSRVRGPGEAGLPLAGREEEGLLQERCLIRASACYAGVRRERQSGRRTRRQGRAWETSVHLGRLRQAWLGCPGGGERSFGKASQGQVTGLAATEGELGPPAWKSLTLRCHGEQG